MKRILIFLLCVGCQKPIKETRLVIPDEVKDYVSQFEMASKISGKNIVVSSLDISFVPGGSMGGNLIGLCILKGIETPRILIDKAFWDNASQWDRRELMFHELGHCVLNKRQHSTGIMSQYHLGPSVYNETTYQFLDNQLFN